MRSAVSVGHVVVASMTAGAIVVMELAALSIATAGGASATALVALPVILILATPIGFTISFLPNLLGTILLMRLGDRYRAARHPLAWAALGFAMAWLMSAAFFGNPGAGNAVLGVVGATCALVCRSGARWTD